MHNRLARIWQTRKGAFIEKWRLACMGQNASLGRDAFNFA